MLAGDLTSNDGSVIGSVEQVLQRNPDDPYILYPDATRTGHSSLDGHQLINAVRYGAEKYQAAIGPTRETDRVVAYLSSSHVSYFINLLSLMTNDYVPLLLSPRNATAGMVDLIQRSKAVALVYETGQSHIVQQLRKDVPGLNMVEAIQSEELLSDGKNESMKEDGNVGFGIKQAVGATDNLADRVILAMHSSGSTAFPKLRYWTNRSMMADWGYDDKSHRQRTFLPAPLFHALGVWAGFSTLRASGALILASFPFSPAALLTAMQKTAPTKSVLAPSVLEDLVGFLDTTAPDRWSILSSLDSILVGGAPCPQEIGDRAVERGVGLKSIYGSTEAGILLGPEPDSNEWNVLRPIVDEQYIKWQVVNKERGIYRMFVKTSLEGFAKGVTDEEWYDTNDLFKQIRPGFWMYRGRADDILVHITGEKTNPVPMELSFRTHPLIHEAVILGQDRFQTCAFILLDRQEVLKYSPLEVMDHVYQAVEDANELAPQHSRLVKELVEVLPFGHDDFPRTESKRNVIRQRAALLLKERENALYERYEKGLSAQGPKQELVAQGDLTDFIVKTAAKIMGRDAKTLTDAQDQHTSLFELGLDSLGATQLRNELARVVNYDLPRDVVFNYSSIHDLASYLNSLRHEPTSLEDLRRAIRDEVAAILKKSMDTSLDDVSFFEIGLDSLGATTLGNRLAKILGKDVKRDIIFDHSTVSGLASTLSGTIGDDNLASTKQLTKAQDLLKKYLSRISSLTPLPADTSPPDRRRILLTGSTGALGTELLGSLLALPNVDKIYCLHRGSNDLQREIKSFASRLGDASILEQAEAEGRVYGVAAKLEEDRLGVGEETYKLLEDVTDILHVGWPVNWSFPVEAFDGTLNGVFNLLRLSTHQRPKAFHFISSIAAYARPPGRPTIPEEPVPNNPAYASKMGYGVSKWIAERMLENASSELGTKVNIFRCGQLSGNTTHGAWNRTDFWAGVLASGVNLGVLPDIPSQIDWLPVDIAANAILELAGLTKTTDQNEPNLNVYHIANPHRAPWSSICTAINNLGHPISVLPIQSWLSLVSDPNNRKRDPAITDQLIPVLHQMLLGDLNDMADLETTKTEQASSHIRESINAADEQYWRTVIGSFEKMNMLKHA
ncbi:hypothetical protein SpCBS45565_g08342 [Spizellomyces sp. 'palustris']|nr:hypothetical protein SpCBS45565_g08342 [Spizellomyces sp. 'palustris']